MLPNGIYINGAKVHTHKFSGGEIQVKVDPFEDDTLFLCAYIFSSDSFMELLLTVDALRIENPKVRLTLALPYLPYARQDRACQKGESFSLKVIIDLINALGFEKVIVVDPHSDVANHLLSNIEVISVKDILTANVPLSYAKYMVYPKYELLPLMHNLVAPDTGAVEKVQSLSTDIIYTASKKRDKNTGKIIETTLGFLVHHIEYFIVDDICDGGGTFIALAKLLKEGGATKVSLYVTHGIFSRGVEPLKEYIDEVYCFYSFISDPFINQIGDFSHVKPTTLN